MRKAVTLALVCSLALIGGAAARSAPAVPTFSKVFVIVEENLDYPDLYSATGRAQAPYFHSLADAHVQADSYYGISHTSLGNYIGLVSGQIPEPADHDDCPQYEMCLRPGPTIGAQLDGAGKTWRGYFETMARPCQHPNLTDGQVTDPYQGKYATRHNPFVYFTEISLNAAYCADHDVPYESNFATDLANGPRDFNLIVPNTCDDGHDTGCGGTTMQVMDRWLAANVPPILSYLDTDPHAALFITFDESGITDTVGCCDQLPLVQGGGHVGFLMVAPGLEKKGVDSVPANHYSLLRTIEEGFGLAPLAQAGSPLQHSMTELFS